MPYGLNPIPSPLGTDLYTLGKSVAAVIAFPLCYLLFMVPVPKSVLQLVAFPLQTFATKVSANIISALTIPVYREGNMLYFAKTQLEVAEAYSGIRSIMSFTMFSALAAYFMQGGWGKRMVLLASAVPLAIFANIVRGDSNDCSKTRLFAQPS